MALKGFDGSKVRGFEGLSRRSAKREGGFGVRRPSGVLRTGWGQKRNIEAAKVAIIANASPTLTTVPAMNPIQAAAPTLPALA